MLSFSFQKLESPSVFFALSFVPVTVESSSTSSSNTYSFVDIKIERRLCRKRCFLLSTLFLKGEYKKEAIVLDTVANLMPVTLICNHEVKAMKFCHTCRISIFFILQLDFFITRDRLITLTLKNASVFCSDAIKINPLPPLLPSYIFSYLFPVRTKLRRNLIIKSDAFLNI